MTDCLHLSEKHRAMVEALLREHLPGVEVWAYGSRVNGRSHGGGSDLDLALRSDTLEPLEPVEIRALTEAFRESNIPFLVDAHDWASLPDSFHPEIERNQMVLVAAASRERAGR
jgi:predicted nucleotidyltransferase